MKVGDLVNINEVRGTGIYKRITALGLGVVLGIQSTDDLTIGTVGPVNLGDLVTVLLDTGEAKVFSERSLESLYS